MARANSGADRRRTMFARKREMFLCHVVRGATVTDIVNTVAITAIQAGGSY